MRLPDCIAYRPVRRCWPRWLGIVAVGVVVALMLGGCAIPTIGDAADAGYGRVVEAIEQDVGRIEAVHDDFLRLGQRLVCGGSGPAPLRSYSGEQVRAWGCYCAAVMPDTFALACRPEDAPTPAFRPEE